MKTRAGNDRGTPRAADRRQPGADVAIVGMACMFPGAPDLQAFWRNILAKVDATSDPPPDAWNVDVAYDVASRENDRVYCKRGGYLGPIAYFNPFEHGVMPRAAEGGDPDQWLALHVAKQALVDAGYPDGPDTRRDVAVIVGKGNYITRGNSCMVQHGHAVDQVLQAIRRLQPSMTDADLELIRGDLKRDLPRFDAETAGALVPNILAGRIANRLDLMGPSYTVDAACASSLVAVELALRGLQHGEYSMALAGGAHVATPYTLMSLFCQLGALSRTERIRPFDKDADGTLMSEGLGMVVLKRRADAERDGDRIYAVIKGVGVASDGRAVSVLAPRAEGEELALRRAYESSGIDPASISLIEAHGTGTLVGDAVEAEVLGRVLPARGDRLPWCALGTVKSMIGHALPAAGMAGLIRAALALYHKVLPATIHVTEPSPRLNLERTPLYLNTETRPWIHRADAPRRAGLNAFGFGGINAHVILEEHPQSDEQVRPGLPLEWDSEVFLLRGESRADLVRRAESFRQSLDTEPERPLAEMACDLNVRQPGPDPASTATLAIVASSRADLGQKLDRALARLAKPTCRRIKEPSGLYFTDTPLAREGKLAFLFPGEGAQFTDMLADLCLHFPQVRAAFDEMDAVMAHRTTGGVPSQYVFPAPAFSAEERAAAERRLFQMEAAIEAVVTANQALFALLGQLGIRPDALVGHSTGEYSAMRAAGMIDEPRYPDHLRRLNDLYQASLGSVPDESTLLAIGADRRQVERLLADVAGELYVAMDNCPHQVVLVGAKEPAARAAEVLAEKGLLYEALRFDRAYHTPMFARFADALRDFQDGFIVAPPALPLYSCTIAERLPDDLAEIRRISLDHWMRPVEFVKTIERMHDDGIRLFVEVGPRGNLTAFVDDILGERPHLAVPASVLRRSGIEQINHLVGMLAANGVPMRLDALYERRVPPRVDAADGAPARPTAAPMKLATGFPQMSLSEATAARVRQAQPSRLAPAGDTTGGDDARPVHVPAAASAPPLQPGPAAGPAAPLAGAAEVMSSYLQTMEQFLALQQRVVQGLAGAEWSALPADVRPAVPQASALADVIDGPAPGQAVGFFEPWAVASPPPAVAPSPMAVAPPPRAGAEPPAGGLDRAGVADLLLRLVAEKTGYPLEMLDLGADIEADLGIDSIKRVEILGAFQRQAGVRLGDRMERVTARKTLLATIDELAGVVEAPGAGTPPPAHATAPQSPPAFPFLNEIESWTPGEALVARCDVSIERYPFLRDHTFGRQVSLVEPELLGWTIMPLTMSMEILAEGGASLLPDRVLVGMRDIRTYRWIALEQPVVGLRITARRQAPDAVHVQIREADRGDAGAAAATPIIEGVMVFADRHPDPPPVRSLTLREEARFRWRPDELYEEIMFHGPSMQGVVSMDRVGLDGAEATLVTLPTDGMFARDDASRLVTDGNLLDQVGQVVGFWAAQVPESPYLVPPFRLEELHLYGPSLAPGTRVTCQARIALMPERQVRSELDVIDPSGRLWARLVGWENRRFPLPPSFYKYLLTTRDLFLSEAWSAPVTAGMDGCRVYRLGVTDFLDGWFTTHGGFWRRVFVHLVLGRREREIWHGMKTPDARRVEWLLGRMAAKDAVRHLVRERDGLALCPADVEILPDENGRPVVAGRWTAHVSAVPVVSIAHAEGHAVAIAGYGASGFGLGVDLERIDRMTSAVEELAFTPEEEHLLSGLRHRDESEWPLRFWCAKEAVAKAIGEGMRRGPRGFVVRRVDPDNGAMDVSVAGDGVTMAAFTARDGDLVVAASSIGAQRSMGA